MEVSSVRGAVDHRKNKEVRPPRLVGFSENPQWQTAIVKSLGKIPDMQRLSARWE
jgi:hypothetical protein